MADNLTPQQRSYCMSQVKGKNTRIEQRVFAELDKLGLEFCRHVKELPGTPDIVFPTAKVAVFLDGDFWHGYRFPSWKHKVSDFWKDKISRNRERDRKNRRKLGRMGWTVIRLWEHQIERDLEACVCKIVRALTVTCPTSNEKGPTGTATSMRK